MAIFTVSLAATVAALEVLLRLAGFVLQLGYQPDHAKPSKFSGKTIVCIGDSYTYGGEVRRDTEAYPAALQRLLDKRRGPGKYRVLNLGICESTTSEQLRNLPGWLKDYKPDVVILLAGSANRFAPFEYKKGREGAAHEENRLFDFRVAQMARLIVLNIKAGGARSGGRGMHELLNYTIPVSRGAVTNSFAHAVRIELRWKKRKLKDLNPEKPLDKLWILNRTKKYGEGIRLGRETLAEGTADKKQTVFAMADLYFNAGKYNMVEKLLEDSERSAAKRGTYADAMAYYQMRIGDERRLAGNFEEAIGSYLKGIELDPNQPAFYFFLTKCFDLQSRYSADEIYRALIDMNKRNPMIAESKSYQSYLALFRDKKKWDSGVEKWISGDLEAIAELCEKNGAKLIAQNYPVDYSIANRQLKRVAEKRSLPLVDNQSVFATLEPKKKYFRDDDHCSPAGHDVMAENVYKIFESKGL